MPKQNIASDIVLVMGYPASGKTTEARQFVDRGYARLNRDTEGGKVADLVPKMVALLSSGKTQIVIDNLFANKASRQPFIEAAQIRKVPIRCVRVDTSIEDAQLNACMRMVRRFGDILSPDEIKKTKDANTFPIGVIFRYRKAYEAPTTSEGFTGVTTVGFSRKWGLEYTNKAIIFDYDGVLRRSTGSKVWPEHPNEVQLIPNRIDPISFLKEAGFLLLGVSNQSACSKGLSIDIVRRCFDRTNELLGHKIDVKFCPHRAAPPTCYCRKPFPGLAAHFIEEHKLLPEKCFVIGDQTSDKTFAGRAGMHFWWVDEFFAREKYRSII